MNSYPKTLNEADWAELAERRNNHQSLVIAAANEREAIAEGYGPAWAELTANRRRMVEIEKAAHVLNWPTS